MNPRTVHRLISFASIAAITALSSGGFALTARAAVVTTTLTNSALQRLDHATLVGPVDPAKVIGIGVGVSRPNPAGEAAYIHSAYDPSSPQYHQFLTPAAFEASFGVSAQSVQALTAWLQSGGLAVQPIPGVSDYVTASGTAAQIESLLSIAINNYTFQGTAFYAGATQPTVPAQLGILGISGLNNLEGPRLAAQPNGRPAARPAIIGPNTNMGLTTPFDLWSIYDQPGGNKGDGQQLAIFGWGTTRNTESDLRQFEREYHFPNMPLTINYYGPETQITDSGGEGEWNIDTQASSGMAPNAAAQKLYFGKAGTDPDLIAAYNAWAGDASGPLQGSSSFSGCEEAPGTDTFSSGVGSSGGLLTIANAMQDQYEAALGRAVAEGRTMFASTGDTGSGCPAISLLLNGVTLAPTPQQGYPAISPFTVGVGGTVLYWDGGGASPATGSTATRAFETSWTHTGGGTSLFLKAPDYQQGVLNIVGHCGTDPHGNPYVPPAPLCRGNPDVAAQSGDVAGNGYTVTSSGTNNTAGGGTSLSSPLWLGMWARIQAAAPNPAGNGFANNSFYTIGKDATKYANDFFDVGNPANTSTASTCNGANCSHLGWDYTSGWGTPDVAKLMVDLDGTTTPRITPPVNPPPPPPAPDLDNHGGTTCPGPQIVDVLGDALNNTPGGPGLNAPNYDLVNGSFASPDANTLRVTIAVADLEGSPNGPADANLGQDWISALWDMKHSETGSGLPVTYMSSTLSDSSKAWTANEWAGGTVTVGAQTADVVSNTATTLTLFSPWAPTPPAGSAYVVAGTTTYYALARSTGPGAGATWSFFYGQYDGNLFHNQHAANATSHATNGAYAGGPQGTVVVDVPLNAVIGSPAQGSQLENVRAETHGGPVTNVTYWTAAVDRAPNVGHGAPYFIGQTCPNPNIPEAPYAVGLVGGGFLVIGVAAWRRRRRRLLAGSNITVED